MQVRPVSNAGHYSYRYRYSPHAPTQLAVAEVVPGEGLRVAVAAMDVGMAVLVFLHLGVWEVADRACNMPYGSFFMMYAAR